MNRPSPISDWKLERFLLGELDPQAMEAVRAAVATDAGVRERLEALRASNADILRDYPPGWMGQRIRERLPREAAATGTTRRQRMVLVLRPIAPFAVAAVVVIGLLVGLPTTPPGEFGGVRIKGPAEQLMIYRQGSNGSEQLRSGDRAFEHDVVLLRYQVEQPCFGVIVSIDGRGGITPHLPELGSRAVAMEPGEAAFLEHAYELDDAPQWEQFLLVTAPREFVLELVTNALANADPPTTLELPDEFRVTAFTLLKESGHAD